MSDLPEENGNTPALNVGSAPSTKIIKKKFFWRGIGLGDAPWRAREVGPFKYWIAANSVYPLP